MRFLIFLNFVSFGRLCARLVYVRDFIQFLQVGSIFLFCEIANLEICLQSLGREFVLHCLSWNCELKEAAEGAVKCFDLMIL
jgi:hypothetical protein